ncbi:uncharacterized protein BO87DRAFT_378081 [Aspergillus neoniger CBS 115656]|uniref:Uncharacterized protein n=1 Tax=Aspergillus neoniger (strain CBS 115656) TaxID=1448310 RepID=A0A318YJB9_ASPNB|nr:hypothetical protein BO87DRAFT_378081 [Aspergillus neoniger CBS 115656]PYH32590.1 hypothetical protein BO87DRAFT_378081 [Aspergillus neoniger CBS 115656]
MVSGQLRARPSVQGTLPEPVTANDSVVPCLPSSISPHCGSAAADLWFNCALLVLSTTEIIHFQRRLNSQPFGFCSLW